MLGRRFPSWAGGLSFVNKSLTRTVNSRGLPEASVEMLGFALRQASRKLRKRENRAPFEARLPS